MTAYWVPMASLDHTLGAWGCPTGKVTILSWRALVVSHSVCHCLSWNFRGAISLFLILSSPLLSAGNPAPSPPPLKMLSMTTQLILMLPFSLIFGDFYIIWDCLCGFVLYLAWTPFLSVTVSINSYHLRSPTGHTDLLGQSWPLSHPPFQGVSLLLKSASSLVTNLSLTGNTTKKSGELMPSGVNLNRWIQKTERVNKSIPHPSLAPRLLAP